MSTPTTARRSRVRYEPPSTPPVAWIVGDGTTVEFAAIRNAIGADEPQPSFDSLAEAAATLARTAPPEVLFLAQSRPGCLEQSAIDRFQILAPLTRIAIVAGSWCEGELRTGRPLVGAVRLYWHEFSPWWRRNLTLRATGVTPDWSRPADPSVAIVGADAFNAPSPSQTTIAVDAIDFSTFEAIADALRPVGFACKWAPRGRGKVAGASAAIWDGGQLDRGECDALATLRARFEVGAVPIVALLDYPRGEHIREAQSLGAAVVLGKPYSVASLIGELRRVIAAK